MRSFGRKLRCASFASHSLNVRAYMVTYLIALLYLLCFLSLAFILYQILRRAISNKNIKPITSCFTYGLAILILPWFLLFPFVQFGNFLYTNYPSLKVAAWDVGLALILWLCMYAAYTVGLVVAGVASWRFISIGKSLSSAALTHHSSGTPNGAP